MNRFFLRFFQNSHFFFQKNTPFDLPTPGQEILASSLSKRIQITFIITWQKSSLFSKAERNGGSKLESQFFLPFMCQKKHFFFPFEFTNLKFPFSSRCHGMRKKGFSFMTFPRNNSKSSRLSSALDKGALIFEDLQVTFTTLVQEAFRWSVTGLSTVLEGIQPFLDMCPGGEIIFLLVLTEVAEWGFFVLEGVFYWLIRAWKHRTFVTCRLLGFFSRKEM
jgi:hypothetical protein